MQILFIRHATARQAGRGGDAARKLTGKGVQEANALAAALKAMGLAPDKILTSPLARATQTAAIIGEQLGAGIQGSALLAPDGDRAQLRGLLERLAAQGIQTVALVGHSPTLEEMVGELIAGTPAAGISLSKAGAALVELTGNFKNPELRWLLRRSQVELMRA